jgi:hypothetical protein
MTKFVTFLLSLSALGSLGCSSGNHDPAGPSADAGSLDAAHAPEAAALTGIYKSSSDTTAHWSYVTLKTDETALVMDNSYLLPSVLEVQQIALQSEPDGWRGTRLTPTECGCTNVCWLKGTLASYQLTSSAAGSIRVEIAYFAGEWDPISDLGISDFSASEPVSCLEREYPAIPLSDSHLQALSASDEVVAERCPEMGYSGAGCTDDAECCSKMCRFGKCD